MMIDILKTSQYSLFKIAYIWLFYNMFIIVFFSFCSDAYDKKIYFYKYEAVVNVQVKVKFPCIFIPLLSSH